MMLIKGTKEALSQLEKYATLMVKLLPLAGRLNLVLETMADLAYAYHWGKDIQPHLDKLAGLANEYEHHWFSETAQLFKEIYNRRTGP